ncbi:MAG: DUF2274 domain-containing protein, partial [Hyphomicrobiales bacterium]|nr:DUF2274 domain-containing protein [Hyphomicrobiales bacterium]
DIIPHMLDAFIKTDRGFQKTNRTSAFGEISDAKTNHSNDGN